MGVSYSFEDLAQKVGNLGDDLGKVTHEATRSAAEAAKEIFLTSASAATGGDLRLSQVGKNGAKLGVQTKLHGTGAETSAQIRSTGPWQFVENPITAHLITSKRAGGSRRSRARRFEEGATGEGLGGGRRAMLRTPYGPRPYVIHPGIKMNMKPWNRSIPIVARTTPVVFEREAKALMWRTFA